MFKKILLHISILLLLTSRVSAFLWESSSIDLYKDIELWMQDIELKNFEYEIKWWWNDISKELNRVLVINELWECIVDGISSSDIKKIAEWSVSTLYNNVKSDNPDCIDWWWDFNIKNIDEIMSVIREAYYETIKKSDEKSDAIYKISSIWIYSDWDVNNSSFDLIHDMQEIARIIFSEEIKYEWELLSDNNLDFRDFLLWNSNPINPISNDRTNYNWNNTINNDNQNTSWNDTIDNSLSNNSISFDFLNDNSISYACVDNESSSWLSSATLEALTKNTLEDDSNIINTNSTGSSDTSINIISGKESNNQSSFNDSDSYISRWYARVNDDWPCNQFFCITVNLKTYTENLKWWQSYSIESFLNTSNSHLKKFSSTSLVQSNMTTNTFEIGLSDLNLADSFHMWMLIVKKAPPNLQLANSNADTWISENEKYKEILREYYKNMWLNYDKKNSLEYYFSKQEEYKTIEMSAERSIIAAEVNDSFIKNLELENKKKNEILKMKTDKEIVSDDMKNFERKFILLEWFTSSVYDYSQNALWIITKMLEIPIKK